MIDGPGAAAHSPEADDRSPAVERGGLGPLPAVEPRDLEPLHPAAVTLWRVAYALRGAGFVAIGVVSGLVLDIPMGLALAAAAGIVTVVVVVAVPPARYRSWGYRLRESDLYLRYGLLIRTTTIVPHARIQHVDTRHGPIDRMLGLAEVVVYTAGTRGAVIPIPALDAATAEALRDRLVALSGAGDAV